MRAFALDQTVSKSAGRDTDAITDRLLKDRGLVLVDLLLRGLCVRTGVDFDDSPEPHIVSSRGASVAASGSSGLSPALLGPLLRLADIALADPEDQRDRDRLQDFLDELEQRAMPHCNKTMARKVDKKREKVRPTMCAHDCHLSSSKTAYILHARPIVD